MLDMLRYLRHHPALLRTVVSPHAAPPTKDVYRPTITPALRSFLQGLGGSDRTFLEVGCDVGLNLTALSGDYARLVGIEINPVKARIARFRSLRSRNVEIVTGTAYDAPIESFDVVLVDAVHLYVDVLVDLLCVLNRTTADVVDVVFHDYGLVGGEVRAFVDDVFGEYATVGAEADWNRLGQGADGPEAAWVRIERQPTLQRLREALGRNRPALPSLQAQAR